jgi:hypothetical protein
MITPWLLLTLASLFGLSYQKTHPEGLIVGLWKHRNADVFFRFFKNGGMYFKIPLAQGAYEISGRYTLMYRNLLKIELDCQYGSISGEPIFTNPQVLKVTIHEDKIIFHDLKINDSEEQEFIRIKQK